MIDRGDRREAIFRTELDRRMFLYLYMTLVSVLYLANHPVQTVEWYDVVKWTNARSQQAELIPVYYTDAGLTQCPPIARQ